MLYKGLRKPVDKSLWFVVFIISIFTLSVFLLTSTFINEESLKLWLDAYLVNNSYGWIFLGIIITCLLTIGLPRQLSAFSAGYCFGTIEGTLLATLCAAIACWLTLSIARFFFSNYFSARYPDKLNKVHSFFSQQTFIKAVIIRILPVGSNFLTNILAGIAKSPTKPYVLGSALGFIPQMYIFALAGSGVKLAAYQQVYVSVGLLIIASLLGAYIYKVTKFKAL